MTKAFLFLALAFALHAEDAKPFLLTIDPASVNDVTVIAFYCELTEEAEEQGFRDCGPFPGHEVAPDWRLGLDLTGVCPLNEATFVFSSGPVKILWPKDLKFELTTTPTCDARPWLYYHSDWNGGFVGLRLDPKTQQLSVEQSEVAYR